MKIKISKLDNGLRVTTDYMKDVESVSVSIWVDTGSRNEIEKNNGVSHFLEHMAFKGTKSRTAQQIAEEFDDIGGKVNAFTSKENTVYYAKVLKEEIETAVEILADIFQNSSYNEQDIESERKVILQEIAMVKDTPDDIIFDYYSQTAFSNQPFGRNILGAAKTVKNLRREDLINYIKKQYKTENIVIAFAGKSKHEANIQLVKKYFQNLNKGSQKESEKAYYTGGDFRKQQKLEQVHMILGFNGFSYHNKNFYKANILGLILGGGISSRLFQEIREKRGLCYSIYAFSSSNSDNGSFKIYTGISPKKTNEVIDAIIEELKKAARNIKKEELKRAITKLKSSIVMSRENTDARAQKLGSDLLAYNRVRTMKEIMKELKSITTKDLEEIMQDFLNQTKPTLAILGNVEGVYKYEEVTQKLRENSNLKNKS
jgi:predicted Zn-dependent peptidase